MIAVDPFDLVIFGGTGDLAMRKLLPALFRRYAGGQVPNESRIVGVARSHDSAENYRSVVREAIKRAVANADAQTLENFLALVHYYGLDATQDNGWREFADTLVTSGERVRVFYLSTSPNLFVGICERLRQYGLNGKDARVVIEKPIGHDLASAMAINNAVGAAFAESQVFRIDHYLGKETVQNLLALRFGNVLFEPLWNAAHIDHVQITVAETVGLEKRATYYDTAGALRDMVQNHMLQLLC
ncbi:MAG: glucose-6-phosphate dehydrogenase, partial [Rudaea sp.]